MSILFKGMKMPKNCYGCPLSEQREETDMGARFTYMVDCKKNSFDDGTFEGRRKTRPDWCPLIEVPTPHGRLGDLDALMELYEPAPEDVNEWEHYTTTISVIRQNIKDAPTVIEAEEEE